MGTIASQITSLTIVYSIVYSDTDQRKHQSSASLAFVWGIHRDPWIPRTKGQLRGKCFHLMTSSWEMFLYSSLSATAAEKAEPTSSALSVITSPTPITKQQTASLFSPWNCKIYMPVTINYIMRWIASWNRIKCDKVTRSSKYTTQWYYWHIYSIFVYSYKLMTKKDLHLVNNWYTCTWSCINKSITVWVENRLKKTTRSGSTLKWGWDRGISVEPHEISIGHFFS